MKPKQPTNQSNSSFEKLRTNNFFTNYIFELVLGVDMP